MKILLSAYACEPGKGSEPGVGWHWSLELARQGHQVWVLTRENNRPGIEFALAKHSPIPGLRFVYCDLPFWAMQLKKRGPFLQLYYALWQWKAYQKARLLHREHVFDLVHHLTFGVFRQASFMGELGIPFLLGPVGGGERAPFRLRYRYSLKAHWVDIVRDGLNILSKLDPVLRRSFRKASLILVKTPETRAALPASYHHKVYEMVEIGIEPDKIANACKIADEKQFRLLYVGRFIPLKGIQYGLDAFAQLHQSIPHMRLTLVGEGPSEKAWRKQAQKSGIADKIQWINWVDKTELSRIYAEHDALLFPSLHDSSGNVILEAMAQALPVISLSLGGPTMLVNNECGRLIDVSNCTPTQVAERLANVLRELANNPETLSNLSQGALKQVTNYHWKKTVERAYTHERILNYPEKN